MRRGRGCEESVEGCFFSGLLLSAVGGVESPKGIGGATFGELEQGALVVSHGERWGELAGGVELGEGAVGVGDCFSRGVGGDGWRKSMRLARRWLGWRLN